MKDKVLNHKVKKIFNSLIASYGGDQFGNLLAERLFHEIQMGLPPAQKLYNVNDPPKEPGRLVDILAEFSQADHTMIIPSVNHAMMMKHTGDENDWFVSDRGERLATLSIQRGASFHEFLAKLLWLLWDVPALQEYFVVNGLFVLSNLFGCYQSLTARVFTALMLAILLGNGHFDQDANKQASAENGINQLLSEMERGEANLKGDFHTELNQISNSRTSLVKLHTLLNQFDEELPPQSPSQHLEHHLDMRQYRLARSEVAARLGLYLLREVSPNPELFCRFYPVIRAWVMTPGSQDGGLYNQGLAADILLQMMVQPPEHYSDKLRTSFEDKNKAGSKGDGKGGKGEANGGEIAQSAGVPDLVYVPWFLQEPQMLHDCARALMSRVGRQTNVVQEALGRCQGLLKNQTDLIRLRMELPVPHGFMHLIKKSFPQYSEKKQTANARPGESPVSSQVIQNINPNATVFESLDHSSCIWHEKKLALKSLIETGEKDLTSLMEMSSKKLPDRNKLQGNANLVLDQSTTGNMDRLRQMIADSASDFHEAQMLADELQALEGDVGAAQGAVKAIEKNLEKARLDMRNIEQEIEKRQAQCGKLRDALLEAKMGQGAGAAHDPNVLQSKLTEIEAEVAKLEGQKEHKMNEVGGFEQQRNDARNAWSGNTDTTLALRQKQQALTARLKAHQMQLTAQQKLIENLANKWISGWDTVLDDISDVEEENAKFQKQLQESFKLLVAERDARQKLMENLAASRDALVEVGKIMQSVDDFPLDQEENLI